MKKFLLVLFALLPMCGFAQQQEPEFEVQRIEWSMNFGASLFKDKFFDVLAPRDGYVLDTELRYNFLQVPVDVGLMLNYDMRIMDDYAYDRVDWYDSNTFMAVSDYNFRRGHGVSCFAGLGVGVTSYYRWDAHKFTIMPRVGVEFFNFLRVTAAYQVGMGSKQNLNITLGLVIGGYRKRW